MLVLWIAMLLAVLIAVILLRKSAYPRWLNVLNLFALLPMMLAPAALSVYCSSFLVETIQVIGLSCYPLLLLGSVWLSYGCYKKGEKRWRCYVLPL